MAKSDSTSTAEIDSRGGGSKPGSGSEALVRCPACRGRCVIVLEFPSPQTGVWENQWNPCTDSCGTGKLPESAAAKIRSNRRPDGIKDYLIALLSEVLRF